MSVRTYNPSVRVGNWNEDIQLEEDTLKDFLEKRERGELLIQQSQTLKSSALEQVYLSTSKDGRVRFGDIVMIVNPGLTEPEIPKNALSFGTTKEVTSSQSLTPSARNTYVITSCDGAAEGDVLKYGQSFNLCTKNENLYLFSDARSFGKSAKKSRNQLVSLADQPSHLTEWMVKAFDPRLRMELEFSPINANSKLILTHVKTNQNLCLEHKYLHGTTFGREFEVSGSTCLNSHKAEEDTNHWIIAMTEPGNSVMPVAPPTDNLSSQ